MILPTKIIAFEHTANAYR